ncbi:MAG TPA: hypothetical protein P5181_03020 [Dermatophilaceae bacterium]|nr:hypothetical protein [Dermatophilaceae bacterium]
MRMIVEPDELVAAAGRLADDGDLLRRLADVVESAGRVGSVGSGPETARAIGSATATLGDALRVLGAAAEALSDGLGMGGRAYGDAEQRAIDAGRVFRG